MRAFIAIPLPESAKQKLFELQESLKAAQADVKWVNPNNIHLTLKFMGDLNEKKLPLLKEAMTATARDHPAFPARIAGLETFPHDASPRVVWVGIAEGEALIQRLCADLQSRVAEMAGIPKDRRPFTSHITIGRVRSPKNKKALIEQLKFFEGKELDGAFRVGMIALYQSTLLPEGPLYEMLQEAPLKSQTA